MKAKPAGNESKPRLHKQQYHCQLQMTGENPQCNQTQQKQQQQHLDVIVVRSNQTKQLESHGQKQHPSNH